MLSYFYTHDYRGPNLEKCDGGMLLDARVYAIADKYLIPDLRALAATRFEEGAQSQWSTPNFADAIDELYTERFVDNRKLREVVVEAVRNHATELFGGNQAYEKFVEVHDRTGEFSAACSKALALNMPRGSQATPGITYRCANSRCDMRFTTHGEPEYLTCPGSCGAVRHMDWWRQYCLERK